MRAVICQGDPTSHGGKVLEGNSLMKVGGKAVARKGHIIFCPQCKGTFRPARDSIFIITRDSARRSMGWRLKITVRTIHW